MVAVSAGAVVPGVVLTRPEWLAERISDMGISWGTGDSRISGTLWWCMAASSLIDPVVTAYASGRAAPDTVLEHLRCEVRPDGGIERVFAAAPATEVVDRDAGDTAAAGGPATGTRHEQSAEAAEDRAIAASRGQTADSMGGQAAGTSPEQAAESSEERASGGAVTGSAGEQPADGELGRAGADVDDDGRECCETRCDGTVSVPAENLRETVARIVPVVAEVSGAGVASLWAIVADAIGNRALDAGNAEAGMRLAEQVAGRLPVPRFTDVGGRTFVRRISCCLVFEVPGCQMCTSCPKRPPAQRHELLSALAARG